MVYTLTYAVRLSGDDDARALIDLASTYAAAGDKTRAREYARKAVAAAGAEPALKQYVEQEARRLGAETKEDRK